MNQPNDSVTVWLDQLSAQCTAVRRLGHWLTMLALCSGAVAGPLFAEDSPHDATPKKQTVERKTRDRLEERVRKLESLLARSEAAPGDAGRYQWRTIGEQLVVLDTQTGATRVVDLSPNPAIQHVHVGQAWVVVTVLGNVSQRPAESADPSSARKSPAPQPVKPVKSP
jgi:hypothetical protein